MKRFMVLLLALFATLPVGAVAIEYEEPEHYTKKVQQLFDARDYAALEAMAGRELAAKRRDESGEWYIGHFNHAFRTLRGYELDLLLYEGRLEKWMERFPESPVAPALYAEILIRQGMLFRGEGPAAELSAEQQQALNVYVERARGILDAAKSRSNPGWYAARFAVGRHEKWSEQEFRALLDEASAREPAYFDTYYAAASLLEMRSAGGRERLQRLLEYIEGATASSEGKSVKARVYLSIARRSIDDFVDAAPDWTALKISLDDLTQRYPSARNQNTYANLTCIFDDREKMLEVVSRTGGVMDPRGWLQPKLYGRCVTIIRNALLEKERQTKAEKPADADNSCKPQ